MSDYSKITNFLSKDSLALNDPAKYVKGSEIDAEYNAIAVAVATKADTDSPTLTTPTLGIATATSLQAIIGNVTPAAGTFTTLTTTGAFTSLGLDDNATAKALTLSGSGANSVTIANSATNPTIGVSGGSLAISSQYSFFGTSVANYIQLQGNTTLNSVGVIASGSDSDIGLRVSSKGAYAITLNTNESVTQVAVTHTAAADRYITLTGSNGGNPTIGTSGGQLAISSAIDTAGGLRCHGGTATAAGGTLGFSMGTDVIGIHWGSGAPSISASNGSIYLRTDGAAGTTIYMRVGGAWVANA